MCGQRKRFAPAPQLFGVKDRLHQPRGWGVQIVHTKPRGPFQPAKISELPARARHNGVTPEYHASVPDFSLKGGVPHERPVTSLAQPLPVSSLPAALPPAAAQLSNLVAAALVPAELRWFSPPPLLQFFPWRNDSRINAHVTVPVWAAKVLRTCVQGGAPIPEGHGRKSQRARHRAFWLLNLFRFTHEGLSAPPPAEPLHWLGTV